MSDDKSGQCEHGYYGLCPRCYETLRAELAELRARAVAARTQVPMNESVRNVLYDALDVGSLVTPQGLYNFNKAFDKLRPLYREPVPAFPCPKCGTCNVGVRDMPYTKDFTKERPASVPEAVRALVHAAFHLLDDSTENPDGRISIDNDISADDLRALSDALDAIGIESREDIDTMLASSLQTVPEVVFLQRDNLHASVVDAVSLLNKTFLTDESAIRAGHILREALVQYADAILASNKEKGQ